MNIKFDKNTYYNDMIIWFISICDDKKDLLRDQYE